jgi:hypothetical protein
VQRAFLSDMIDKALGVPGVRFCLAYTPEWALEAFKDIYGEKFAEYHPQEGADLGERMARAFDCAFGRGAKKAVIVGTDVPTMPVYYICAAFNRLDGSDLVLGPAVDGGYYLVGLKRPEPRLFGGIEWSGAGVLKETLSRARSLGMKVDFLPGLRDIDTFDDLRSLIDAPLSRNTRMLMKRLEGRLRTQSDWFG